MNATTFKVFGYDNLRVVDASVIPKLTQSAGLLASVYMIAELVSDKLVAEYALEDDVVGGDSGGEATLVPTSSPMDDVDGATLEPTSSPVDGEATIGPTSSASRMHWFNIF